MVDLDSEIRLASWHWEEMPTRPDMVLQSAHELERIGRRAGLDDLIVSVDV